MLMRRQFENRKLVQTDRGPMLITELNRPDGKVLICDANVFSLQQFSQHSLNESDVKRMQNNHSLILVGKLQAAEDQNQNGRSYPRKILEREVANYMIRVKQGLALGEIDHPQESTVVEYKNATHRVLDLWWKNNEVWGKIEFFNHPDVPDGKKLSTLHLVYGIPIGMSSRGLGSLTEAGGRTIVNDDYQIICWDAVTDPSTHNAFVMQDGAVLRENKKNELPKQNDRIDDLFTNIKRLNQ